MLPENEKKKINRNVLIGFTTGEGGITPKDFKIFYPALHGSLVFAVLVHIMKFYKYGIFFAVSWFFFKMHKNVWTAFQKPFKVVFPIDVLGLPSRSVITNNTYPKISSAFCMQRRPGSGDTRREKSVLFHRGTKRRLSGLHDGVELAEKAANAP